MSATPLIERQNHLYGVIARCMENFRKKGAQNMTLGATKTRLELLKDNWAKFEANHENLLDHSSDPEVKDNIYFTDDLFTTCQEAYLDTKSELLDMCFELEKKEPDVRNGTQPSARSRPLPKISLPRFSGKYCEWPPFRDLFTSMVISNTELAQVEKLQYLKTNVSGDALKLITGIPVTDANFDRAWERLVSRFENKRALVNSHLDVLFSLKPVTKKCPKELDLLRTTVAEVLESLEALGAEVDKWSYFLVYFVCRRLDPETHEAWELELGASTNPPNYSELDTFLESRVRALETVGARTLSKPRSSNSTPSTQPPAARVHTSSPRASLSTPRVTPPTRSPCPSCSGQHYIANCPSFKSMNAQERREWVSSSNLCFNCLGQHHRSDCRSTKRCTSCGRDHHSALHENFVGNSNSAAVTSPLGTVPTPRQAAGASTSTSAVHHAVPLQEGLRSQVLLATAIVSVISPTGHAVRARALLDQGSELSFVTESLVQSLRLPRHHSAIALLGIGAQSHTTTRGAIMLHFQSHLDSSIEYELEAHVLPKLSGKIPSSPVTLPGCPMLDGVQLADPDYNTPGFVDVLLGANIYGQLLNEEVRKGDPSAPVAQSTTLGWIVSGPVCPAAGSGGASFSQGLFCAVEENLNELVQEFWTQEMVPSPRGGRPSEDDEFCERLFLSTHTRDDSGRYTVRLPFREKPSKLGDSRSIAARMLGSMHRRFKKDATFQNLYVEFLEEYASLGHMRRLERAPADAFYLPHHGVLRESSITTKLRVVFNGSQKTSSGHSINDFLLAGPKMQQELTDVLMRWRRWPYVFSSDVEKMFRQVSVHPEDRRFQCILWGQDPAREPSTYELATLTYGMTSSPYLAIRVVHQLAKDEREKFPMAAEVVEEDLYVDDVLSGQDSVEAAQEKVRQIDRMFLAGGFTLRKWISNVEFTLSPIPEERRLNTEKTFQDQSMLKALGLKWSPSSDNFIFSFNEELTFPVRQTKRSVLSFIAKLFDPLGWLAPVVVLAKIFLQLLWTANLQWDDALPENLASRWETLANEFRTPVEFVVPRWLGTTSSSLIEIHGFSDASQAALAAAVFVRVVDTSNFGQTSLLVAKTKVAPLKRVTIARLELSAAVLLSQLVVRVREGLGFKGAPIHLWTDSTVALTWILGHPSKWKEFVGNRVALIQESVPEATWHHVAGTENPADLASRSLYPRELLHQTSWWSGTPWLKQPSTSWPTSIPPPDGDVNLEEKPPLVHAAIKAVEIWDLINRYSDLNRLLRITARLQEAVARLSRSRNRNQPEVLTAGQLSGALKFWIRRVQEAYFPTELTLLQRKESLPRSSPLLRLTPFLDGDGIMRLGGRLQHSSLDADCKNPVILPRHSPLTTLVINQVHRRTLHGGVQLTLSTLRQRYWIVGGRAPVRSFILRCVTCCRHRGATLRQQMGQLPAVRTKPSRPFAHSGVDYAGPFSLRTWRGRGAKSYKAYLVVFVCFTTSAVHLEMTSDYTSDGFIAAYKRFTGRRGLCSTLTSDCGSNLVGADAELRRLFSAASQEFARLRNLLANDGTTWRFNPPSAPHFGGKWEAAVKSAKHHIRRVVGEASLTYEEFSSLLTQIECVLNSRPICPLSEDPDDVSALTPGHFLIGSALNSVPEPSLADLPSSRLSRWEKLRQMLEHFWSRWSREYLQRLQPVSKWQRPDRQLTVGDLVLVCDERYPPSKWPLARVTSVHPGADGMVRVASVRTGNGSVFKRPIVKLCLLPVDNVSVVE